MDNIDNRIVNLQFNNKDFEKNAATSMETCDKLEKKLNFKGIIEGLASLSSAAKSFDLSPVVTATETAAKAFSPLEEMAIGALRRIGEQALQTGEQILKSVTVDQIEQGYGKFDEKTASVQTIMAATGKTVEEVNDQLQMLNWYTDETSYAYTDMTNNIGKFTNAGVKLEDAVTAMVGIGNAAGLAGATVRDASHAMAGFSKAMGQGYMDRLTWSWIKTAHMDTIQFKQSMIDAAVAAGKLIKLENGMYSVDGKTDDNHLVSAATFELSLTKSKWLTSDIITKTLSKYGATTEKIYDYVKARDFEVYTSDAIEQIGISMDDLGLKAFKAAQEAKTFRDALEAVKDAVSTGWMQTFELIVGNYIEAKKVWTDFANWMYDIFVEVGNERNKLLKKWQKEWEFGAEKLGGRAYLFEGIYAIFDTISEYIFAVGDAFKKVFGEDWDANLLRKITQGIHDFAQALASTVENGVFDYETRGGIRWFITNVEQIFHILKRIGETATKVSSLLITTITEALGFTSVTRTMKRSWDATGSAIDSNITKIGKVVYSVLHGINAFITKNFYGNKANQRIRETIRNIGLIVTDLKDILVSVAKSIIAVINHVKKSIGETFVNSTAGFLSILKFITSNVLSLVTATNKVTGNTKLTDIFITIYDICKGILSFLKIGKNIATFVIKTVMSFVSEIRSKLESSGVLNVLSEELAALSLAIKSIFGAILGKTQELSERGDSTERSFGWITLIADMITDAVGMLTKIIPLATKLATRIADFIRGISVLFDSEEPEGAEKSKKSVVDVLKNAIETLFDTVNGDKVSEGAKKFSGSLFENVFSGITTAIKKLDIDWGKIGKFTAFIGFLVGISLFDSALYNLFNMVLGPAGIFTGLGAFINGIGGVVTATKKYVATLTIMNQMKSLALAIATLAGAVWLLGQLPKEALARGVVALGMIATIFGIMMKVLNLTGPIIQHTGAVNNSNSLNVLSSARISVLSPTSGIAGAIFGIVAFVLAIVHALNSISKLNLRQILKSLGAITAMLVLLGGIIFAFLAMAKMVQDVYTSDVAVVGNITTASQSHTKLTNYLAQMSIVIGAIALAVLAFTVAINSMATVAQKNPKGFTKAFWSFIGILGAFAVFIAALSGMEILSTKKFDISGLGNRLIFTAIGMIGVVAALGLLMVPIAALAGLQKAEVDIDSILLELAGMLIMLGAFAVVATAAMAKVRVADILKASGIVLAAVVALNLLIIPINSLASLQLANTNITELLMDMAGMLVGVAVVMGILANVMNTVSTAAAIKAGSLLMIGVFATLLLVAPMSKLAIMQLAGADYDSIVGNMIILTGAIAGILYLLTTLTRTYKVATLLAAAGAFLLMSIAVSSIIKAMKSMQSFPNLESLIGLGVLLVAMGGVLAGLSLLYSKTGSPEDLILISSSMVVMSLGLIAIAGALAILNNYAKGLRWESIWQFATVIGILAAAVVGLGALSHAIPAILPVMKVLSSMIASVALVLISFGAALFLVAKALPIITEYLPQFMDVIKDAAKAMEEHIGVFLIASGVVVALAALITVLLVSFTKNLPSVIDALDLLINSIAQMSPRGKAVTTAFIMALVWGLAEATPEVMDAIETAIKAVLERLGQSLGWIVDGLLKLLIELLDALAEAIRANGGPILFAIVDILEAIGEILVDAIASTLGTLANLIYAAIDAIAIWAESPTMTYAEAFAQSFAGLSDSMKETVHGFKEASKTGMADVKKFLYGLNGYEDTELKLFGDPEEAEKQSGEFFDKLIENGQKAASKVGESLGLNETLSSIKDKLLNGELISTDEFTKLFNMEGFDMSKMMDMEKLMQDNMNMMDPSSLINWQEATAGFSDFSTTVVDGSADMEAATVSLTDTAGEETGEYIDNLANSGEDAEIALADGMDKLELVVNNRQDNFKTAGSNLIQALQDGVDEKWEAVSTVIKSKFQVLADEIRDILSSDNLYADVTPVINASKPYEYQVAAQTALNRNTTKTDTSYAAPTNASVSTDQVQAAASDIANLQSTINASSGRIESLMRVANEKLNKVIDDNDIFHKSFNAYRNEYKNMSIYMDSGELVGAITDEMADALAVKTTRAARTGG